MTYRFSSALAAFFLLPLAVGAEELTADQRKFFEMEVRPLLANNCHKCHSEAQGKSKGGLVLDSRPGWAKGGETGPAIVPGKPEESLLIKAIRYTDKDMQMPPSQSGGQLTPQQIAVLEKWVTMGAPDPREKATAPRDITAISTGLTEEMQSKLKSHWAYQPLKSAPAVPAVKNTAWPKNEIDSFVLNQLEAKALAPSAETDRRTLIRRAYFDLIGLPPTPDEVLAFVNDKSQDAYAKVVDHLLARPQYGERWGRYWLDVARYADTKGEVKNKDSTLSPYAWTYRDYVIKALNSDRPYDQFIKEQIAADLLPTAKTQPGTLAAMGFLTEGNQFQGNRQEILNDQIDVVTKGFLGATASCARCHDHFFDPIPTRDYYSLYGIFDSCKEPKELPIIGAAEDQAKVKDYIKERKDLENQGLAFVDRIVRKNADHLNANGAFFLGLLREMRNGKQKNFSNETMNEIKKHGFQPDDVRDVQKVLALKIRGTEERIKGAKGKGNKAGGNNQEMMAKVQHDPVLGPYLAMAREGKRETFAQAWLRAKAILEQLQKDGTANPYLTPLLLAANPKNMEEVEAIYGKLMQRAHEAYKAEVAAWKEDSKTPIFPGLKDKALEQIRGAFCSLDHSQPHDLSALEKLLNNKDQGGVSNIIKRIDAMDLTHQGAQARANVVYDNAKPQNAFVMLRGEAQNRGPIVPRQFLEFAQPDRKPVPDNQSGRLQLAEAIASKENPLTARVLVNRVWLHHFGEGFVNTPDDLGTMSEPSSNQPLHDWLSYTFMADGWSLKKLHRLIMLSATYQQKSDPNPAMAAIDPFNRLLWRANVRRLDFESMRDNLLSIGGKLDDSQFGHPVNIETEPYSPRRSVYGFIDRLNMAEFLKNFDVANAELPTGKRHQTVVPQQALFRMNSLLVIEQARNVVERKEFKQASSEQEKVKALYELIYQRWPRPEELQLAKRFLEGREAETSEGDAMQKGPRSLAEEQELIESYKKNKLVQADPKTLTAAQREKRQQLVNRIADRQKRLVEAKKKNPNKLNELVTDPNAEAVDRAALTNWEKLSHALLMTNEASYVN